MQSIQEIAAEIVAREGAMWNDPADPGGATKYGVTIHTMRRLGLDLDGNGRVNTADVRRLTKAQAVEIFLRDYYESRGSRAARSGAAAGFRHAGECRGQCGEDPAADADAAGLAAGG